ncbi:hypothetical protein IYQ_01197 [Aeromonas salmonicida subsp. salmonicida 01-B526]|uniref:Uncharacterized protein n=1 Tax=Aeromonas salmonicida subsp. salmonicida 01-B526 TaxID=1076135 RepID=A0ABN0E549_AERSS|nr:hypothetical protein IYQ_01197 [Aeromonas salmonicida subsp. salmonicida 01-B526]
MYGSLIAPARLNGYRINLGNRARGTTKPSKYITNSRRVTWSCDDDAALAISRQLGNTPENLIVTGSSEGDIPVRDVGHIGDRQHPTK